MCVVHRYDQTRDDAECPRLKRSLAQVKPKVSGYRSTVQTKKI